MRTPFHTRLICCWLAILVLAGSMGFGMVEHWCQMRGYSKTLLAAQASCPKPCQAAEPSAPISAEPVVRRAPCCKTTLSYAHLDVSRFVADYHPQPAPQPMAFLPNPQFRLLLAALLPPTSAESAPLMIDQPLHRTGRARLTSHCSWLI